MGNKETIKDEREMKSERTRGRKNIVYERKSENKLNINRTNTRVSQTKCLVAQINKKAELGQKHTLNKNSRSDRKSFAKHKHTQTSGGGRPTQTRMSSCQQATNTQTETKTKKAKEG